VSISADGATKWSKLPIRRRLAGANLHGEHRALAGRQEPHVFVNPNNPTGRERKNVSARLSYDDAKTWPIVKTIEAGRAAIRSGGRQRWNDPLPVRARRRGQHVPHAVFDHRALQPGMAPSPVISAAIRGGVVTNDPRNRCAHLGLAEKHVE